MRQDGEADAGNEWIQDRWEGERQLGFFYAANFSSSSNNVLEYQTINSRIMKSLV